MTVAGIWGLFISEPIVPFIISFLTNPLQNLPAFTIRLLELSVIVAGVIILVQIGKLPSDITAKRIGHDAILIKNAIIEMTQLYKSFVTDAKTHTTEDYFPLIKDDIVVKKDIKAFRDKGIATRSFLTYNPTNPLLERLKETSQKWKDLNDEIERAAMDISDTKLNTYLRTYRNKMESDGMYKAKASAVLGTNPVTTYLHRQAVDLNQEFIDSSTEAARTKLINYLDDLIIEYPEECEGATQEDIVR